MFKKQMLTTLHSFIVFNICKLCIAMGFLEKQNDFLSSFSQTGCQTQFFQLFNNLTHNLTRKEVCLYLLRGHQYKGEHNLFQLKLHPPVSHAANHSLYTICHSIPYLVNTCLQLFQFLLKECFYFSLHLYKPFSLPFLLLHLYLYLISSPGYKINEIVGSKRNT